MEAGGGGRAALRVKDDSGRTVLWHACMWANAPFVEALLDYHSKHTELDDDRLDGSNTRAIRLDGINTELDDDINGDEEDENEEEEVDEGSSESGSTTSMK